MKILSAYKDISGHHYDVWLDEGKTSLQGSIKIGEEDYEEPVVEDAKGRTSETRTRPVYADPGFVRHFDWGNDVDQGTALYEIKLLCEEEIALGNGREEIVLATDDLDKVSAPVTPKKSAKKASADVSP